MGARRCANRDAHISVRAIPVLHGSWPQAFGYAIEAGGRTIVISGDTAPCPAIEEACQGCDVLVHEVYSAVRLARFPPPVQKYHTTFHTSTTEPAAIASRSKPKLLVLYHQMYFGRKEDVYPEKESTKVTPGKSSAAAISICFSPVLGVSTWCEFAPL